MNESPNDPQLEAAVHRALRALPEPTAPARLAPRVMAQIRARAQRPWWQRAWSEWPLVPRVAFVTAALALLAAVSGGGMWLGDRLTPYSQWLSTQVAAATDQPTAVQSFTNALAAHWQVVPAAYLWGGLATAGVLYLLCVGSGTLLVRIVGRALSESRDPVRLTDLSRLRLLSL